MEVKALENGQKAELQWEPQQDRQGLLNTLLDLQPCPEAGTAEMADWQDVQIKRGSLLVAHTAQTAARAFAMGEMDFCTQAPKDLRGFATLMLHPLPSLAQGCFRRIWLLDGQLCPGEAEAWQRRFPKAQVCALPISPALRELARTLDAGDEAFRVLYKVLRSQPRRTLADLGLLSGLDEAQVRLGLEAFRQLKLIEYTPSPFRYALLAPVKCRLGDSPILQTLRALAQSESQ